VDYLKLFLIYPIKKNFDSEEYTIKKWLRSIFIKIKTYSGSNEHIFKAQRELEGFSIDAIKIDTDAVYFDKETGELSAGRATFRVVNRLIGHLTLMFVFTHMLDFYRSETGYRLDIINVLGREDLLDCVRKFGIKTLIKTTQIDSPLGRKVILDNLFALFFMDSYMPFYYTTTLQPMVSTRIRLPVMDTLFICGFHEVFFCFFHTHSRIILTINFLNN